MYRNIKYIITMAVFLTAGAIFYQCQNNPADRAPDVSDIAVQVRLDRFDQALFALDTSNLEAGLKELATHYPDFFPFFLTEIAHEIGRAHV